MSVDNLKFEQVFKICTIFMRINRCHPDIKRDKIWKTQFCAMFTMSIGFFICLVNSILTHDIPYSKYTEAIKNLIMVIVAVTITFKYFILLRYQDSIANLIRIVDDDYESAKQFCDEEREIILKYSLKGVQVCKLWLLSIFATSLLFPIKAFFLMAYGHLKGDFHLVPMFDYTYPSILEVHKNEPAVFCILFAWCSMFCSYALSMYLAFDPIVPILLLHACCQLEVLNRRIINVFSEATNEQEIHENFKKIILKHQDIYNFIHDINANFTVIYEFNMKTSTFLLPFSAFQIVESFRVKEVNLEFIAFFTSTILHFYFPSYYSDLLMETSERLRQAIYACGWEQQSCLRMRKTVLFMLTRARAPLVICTIFYPICLDTFAEICRSAYAIFNLMNAACT